MDHITLILTTGSNNATISLAIQADNEPEIEEQFQVALTLVTPQNQRISSTDVSPNFVYIFIPACL